MKREFKSLIYNLYVMIDGNYVGQSKKTNKGMIKDNQMIKVKVEKRTREHYSKFDMDLTDELPLN